MSKEKVYEIINPSDPYTIKSDDETLACMAVVYLGQGAWGLRELDENGNDVEGDMTLPIFRYGPPEVFEEWLKKKHKIEDIGEYMKKNAGRLADCLDTVIIGDPKQRAAVESMLAAISDEKERREAYAVYADKLRSSLNDIGGRAQECVKTLREAAG